MLAVVMDGAIDEGHALALLRKYNNDLDKAATALLEGETGADALDAFADLPALEAIDAPGPGPRTPPRKSPFFVLGAELERNEGRVLGGE